MKTYIRKIKGTQRRQVVRKQSVVNSVSLHPEQWKLIRQRAFQFDLSQSEVVGVLVNADRRRGIVRQELGYRLQAAREAEKLAA